jgi:hypothetical protein
MLLCPSIYEAVSTTMGSEPAKLSLATWCYTEEQKQQLEEAVTGPEATKLD